jgi:hypothetical protein
MRFIAIAILFFKIQYIKYVKIAFAICSLGDFRAYGTLMPVPSISNSEFQIVYGAEI